MSWGTGLWGTGSWGSLPTVPLTIRSAVAAATTIVRVTLSREPKDSSSTAVGDALNTNSWRVTRVDNGAMFTVTAVEPFDPPLVWDVHVLEGFFAPPVLHRVAAPTLEAPDGDPIAPPDSADFLGVLAASQATLAALAAGRDFASTDLANLPAPNATTVAGTLQLTAAGDYATVTGAELVRKQIIRRLVTKRGEFFHLPDYGIGFAVKEPVPSSDLVKLRAEMKAQILREPEVEDVAVGLALESGVLTVSVSARMRKTGQQVEVGLRQSADGPVGVVSL